jgi:hypothetical protein
MEKIKTKLVKASETGLFHDSRGDVRKLAKVVNMLVDKVNELVDENNRLNRIIAENSPKL